MIRVRHFSFAALLLLVGACSHGPAVTAPAPQVVMPVVIPLPSEMRFVGSDRFVLDTSVVIQIDAGADSATVAIADYLKSMLAPRIKRDYVTAVDPSRKTIALRVDPNASSSAEGYSLKATTSRIVVSARTGAGLFHGVQTLRQLFPVSIEHRAALERKLWVPAVEIRDDPRFEWRGMMLDVSRHFLPPRDVKRFIDNLSLYKINRLHLHLADDQGWRIEIKSRPFLAQIGGTTQVGGGQGGFYTQDEYRDIVSYAASRYITIVPEIDMPAHTNAALASIPELNCDGVAPSLYTGIEVGFSALCVDSARIYPVLTDIIREISSLTPGEYFHIGGDEVMKLNHTQYVTFIERMQGIVNGFGKRMIGWGEISRAQLNPQSIAQVWVNDSSMLHTARGGKVIMSYAERMYIDMKYDTTTILGLNWAGYKNTRRVYDWDPANLRPGVTESSLLGIEAPLWAETTEKLQDYEYLAFPRIIAAAEVGWTAQSKRSWSDFERRIQIHWPRLTALGINAGPLQ